MLVSCRRSSINNNTNCYYIGCQGTAISVAMSWETKNQNRFANPQADLPLQRYCAMWNHRKGLSSAPSPFSIKGGRMSTLAPDDRREADTLKAGRTILIRFCAGHHLALRHWQRLRGNLRPLPIGYVGNRRSHQAISGSGVRPSCRNGTIIILVPVSMNSSISLTQRYRFCRLFSCAFGELQQ